MPRKREPGDTECPVTGFSSRKRRNKEVKAIEFSRGDVVCCTYIIVVGGKILRAPLQFGENLWECHDARVQGGKVAGKLTCRVNCANKPPTLQLCTLPSCLAC